MFFSNKNRAENKAMAKRKEEHGEETLPYFPGLGVRKSKFRF
jgi:hypothetical protein